MSDLNGKEMYFFKDHCPVCRGETKNFYSSEDAVSILFGWLANLDYCPECDILREHDGNYCNNCNSGFYYTKNRIEEKILKKEMGSLDTYIWYAKWLGKRNSPLSIFGKSTSRHLREERARKNRIEEFESAKMGLGELLPEHICWYCGDAEFSIPKEDVEKMYDAGNAKIGYEICTSPTFKPSNNCECTPKETIRRWKGSIFRTECKECHEDSYIDITDLDERELLNILGIKKGNLPDKIKTCDFWLADATVVRKIREVL